MSRRDNGNEMMLFLMLFALHSDDSFELQQKSLDDKKNATIPCFDFFFSTDLWTQILQCVSDTSDTVFLPFTGPGTIPIAGLFTGLAVVGFCSTDDLLTKTDAMVGDIAKLLKEEPLPVYEK